MGDTREGYLDLSGASSRRCLISHLALSLETPSPPLLTPQKEPGAMSHGVPAFHPQRVHQISNEACEESKHNGIMSGLLSRFVNLERVRCERVRCRSSRSRRCQHTRKSSDTPCATTPSLPTSSHLRASPARQEVWWANS